MDRDFDLGARNLAQDDISKATLFRYGTFQTMLCFEAAPSCAFLATNFEIEERPLLKLDRS